MFHVKHALVVVALFLSLRVFDPWPVETVRLKAFDALFSLGDPVTSEYLATYDIDEDALAEKANGRGPARIWQSSMTSF